MAWRKNSKPSRRLFKRNLALFWVRNRWDYCYWRIRSRVGHDVTTCQLVVTYRNPAHCLSSLWHSCNACNRRRIENSRYRPCQHACDTVAIAPRRLHCAFRVPDSFGIFSHRRARVNLRGARAIAAWPIHWMGQQCNQINEQPSRALSTNTGFGSVEPPPLKLLEDRHQRLTTNGVT